VDIKPLITLGGVLIAAMTSEFSDQVTVIALTDIRGALGISRDSGTCIESLYVSAEIVGMAISPWMATTSRCGTRRFLPLCCAAHPAC
jgi:MFS transporter, DHA2 family, multidrug resistance protein